MDGKQVSLGTYGTAVEAAVVYARAAGQAGREGEEEEEEAAGEEEEEEEEGEEEGEEEEGEEEGEEEEEETPRVGERIEVRWPNGIWYAGLVGAPP